MIMDLKREDLEKGLMHMKREDLEKGLSKQKCSAFQFLINNLRF